LWYTVFSSHRNTVWDTWFEMLLELDALKTATRSDVPETATRGEGRKPRFALEKNMLHTVF
jgi:hypothetical protein